MIQANDEYIAIARGECAALDVKIETDGGAYEFGEDDIVVLTVRELPSEDSPVILRAESAPGEGVIVLHEDATDIEPGRYSADICLLRGGCGYQIWPELDAGRDYRERNRKNFVVCAGVGLYE